MRVLHKSGPEWLRLALLPFQAYSVLGYFGLWFLGSYMDSRADYHVTRKYVMIGYGVAFAALSIGALIQKRIGPRKAFLVTGAFAAGDLLFIALMLPDMMHT